MNVYVKETKTQWRQTLHDKHARLKRRKKEYVANENHRSKDYRRRRSHRHMHGNYGCIHIGDERASRLGGEQPDRRVRKSQQQYGQTRREERQPQQ